MISAIAEFIGVIPALWLQNSPKAAINQLPLHREGGQAEQNLSPKEKMHLALAHPLGTGELLIPELFAPPNRNEPGNGS